MTPQEKAQAIRESSDRIKACIEAERKTLAEAVPEVRLSADVGFQKVPLDVFDVLDPERATVHQSAVTGGEYAFGRLAGDSGYYVSSAPWNVPPKPPVTPRPWREAAGLVKAGA